MSAHTAGPWYVRREFGEVGSIYTTDDRIQVAQAQATKHLSFAGPDIEREANANLIAAAPDLLVALREAISIIECFHGPVAWDIYRDHSPEMRRINQAINKATGK